MQSIVTRLEFRTLQPSFGDLLERNAHHFTSFARLRAISKARWGVFWVFFANAINDLDALTSCRHVDGASDAVSPLHPHLPELAFPMLDVRLLHRGNAMLLDQLGDPRESLTHIGAQRIKFLQNPMDVDIIDSFDD